MSIVRIDHVQLAMPAGGEAEAVAFYEGVLQISHVPKPPHLAARADAGSSGEISRCISASTPTFVPRPRPTRR